MNKNMQDLCHHMMRSVFFPSISDHEIQPIINMVVQESISILDAEIRKTTDSVVIIGLKNAQKLIKEHFKE